MNAPLIDLEKAAAIIAKATREPIRYTRTTIYCAGSSGKVQLFDQFGRKLKWSSNVLWFENDATGNEQTTFYSGYRTDFGALLDALEYHAETKAEILACLSEPPEPAVTPEEKVLDSVSGRGVPYPKIIEAFGLDEKVWKEKLRRPKRRGPYTEAFVALGRKGHEGGAIFNPVLFAEILSQNEGNYSLSRCRIVITKHFPEWLDQWDGISETLANGHLAPQKQWP